MRRAALTEDDFKDDPAGLSDWYNEKGNTFYKHKETEAEGAPDPKFAKFDDGACMCVRMNNFARANFWRALAAVREYIHRE